MRFADGTEGVAGFGDFAGKGVFGQWEGPGVWEGMRSLTGRWSGDRTTASKVLDHCPNMLYQRASGLTLGCNQNKRSRSSVVGAGSLTRRLSSCWTPKPSLSVTGPTVVLNREPPPRCRRRWRGVGTGETAGQG
jgi:hypothetical protein